MKKLLKNKKGFTLMEMLIVVAIIVILVAVAVPTFTSQLDNARQATDAANLRGAKGLATAMYLADGKTGTLYYDANAGELVDEEDDIAAYGQSSTAPTGSTGTPKGGIIKVTISDTGDVTYEWIAVAADPS